LNRSGHLTLAVSQTPCESSSTAATVARNEFSDCSVALLMSGDNPRVLAFLAAMLATCIGGCRLDASQTDYSGLNPRSPADGASIPIVEPDLDATSEASDVSAPDSTGAAGDEAPADAPTAQSDGSASGDSLPGCGAARPDISGIVNADGLAIGPDGTIYFTQEGATTGWIGRLRPGDALPDPTWVTVPGAIRLLGLAIDPRGERLYVVAESGGQAINFVELGGIDPPSLQVLVAGLMVPNEAVVGPDGAVYFSDSGDGHIHRVSPEGTTTIVTASAILGPNGPAGLAFGNQGQLYVGVSPDGPIYRLNLADGVETSRARFGDLVAWGNGLVVDRAGSLYVSTYSRVGQGRVWRVPENGLGATVVLTGASFGSMAFGRGALDCLDLYVAALVGPVQRLRTDAAASPTF
jgi:sugar lactone lactonase YvrE